MSTDQPSKEKPASELDKFRQNWLNEVKQKYPEQHHSSQANTSSSTENPQPEPTANVNVTKVNPDQGHAIDAKLLTKQSDHSHMAPITSLTVSERKIKALETYKIAVQKEKEGDLGQALLNYRRAFKLDPDVDLSFRSYLKKESEESKLGTSEGSGSFVKNEEDFEFIKYLHLDEDYKSHITTQNNGDDKAKSKKSHEDLIKIDPLHKLIETWFNPPANDEVESQGDDTNDKSKESSSEPAKEIKSNLLEYGALDQSKPVHLNILPKEAIVKVLQCLALYDMPSVHRFSLTCKRSFLISREQPLWQHLVDLYYDTSYCNYSNFEKTNPECTIDEFVDEHYFGVYQYFWTEYPKIRYDGIYISTCSYIRQGSSESTFNNPVHLVTYYRYIRFYPDGTLIKLLTPDEPVNVVKLLYKESKYKGIMQGQFELTGDLLNVEFKDYQQHRRHLTFNALLNLKSTHRGLFNKLSWIEYYSTDIRDESFDDRSIYSLKQFKPFYFSKVKSIKNWLRLHENTSLNK